MYPVDRSDMSEARARMMKRRRRSLAILGIGVVAFAVAGLLRSGVWWLAAGAFGLGLVSYLWFLRSQALRDRERRLTRQQRATQRRGRDVDATDDSTYFTEAPESVVRIDDDDIDLHSMDTVDLTGLYHEDGSHAERQRQAS